MADSVMRPDDNGKRPANLRVALLLAGVAVAIYLTFIASGVIGALRGG